jgi:hypothetical protein
MPLVAYPDHLKLDKQAVVSPAIHSIGQILTLQERPGSKAEGQSGAWINSKATGVDRNSSLRYLVY